MCDVMPWYTTAPSIIRHARLPFQASTIKNLDDAAEGFRPASTTRPGRFFSGVKPRHAGGRREDHADDETDHRLTSSSSPILQTSLSGSSLARSPTLNASSAVQRQLWAGRNCALMWDLKVHQRPGNDRIFGIIFGIAPNFAARGVRSGMMCYILELHPHRPAATRQSSSHGSATSTRDEPRKTIGKLCLPRVTDTRHLPLPVYDRTKSSTFIHV